MQMERLSAFIALLDEAQDGYILRQLCAILYRYLEKRGRLKEQD